ncbi:MAG: hypothetical protein ACFFD4_21970 [Candidatus Odinarchaeota archaeon]
MPDLLILYLPDLLKYLISTFSLIPVPVLYLLYRRTGVADYLIFAGVFFSLSLSVFFALVAPKINSLIFWQLRHVSMYVSYFLIFLHAVRLAWSKQPKYLTVVMVTWFIMLVILTLLWEPMPNERGVVLFWEMDPHSLETIIDPRTEGSKLPEMGAGLVINGVIILSTSHPLLAYGFYFLTACTYLCVILTQKPANPTPRITIARRLWILTGIVNFSATGLLLFWPFSVTYELAVILVIVELVLIAVVALKYPESMLITHVQLVRARKLYEIVQTISEKQIQEVKFAQFGIASLSEYLKSIPEDLMEELISIKPILKKERENTG